MSRGLFRRPKLIGSPVLESVLPVVRNSRHVRTNVAGIVEHAGWMAYEELPLPDFALSFGIGADSDEAIDFLMVANTLDFAFTDFKTGEKFEAEYRGRTWSDAEALFACLKRALDEGIPVLDGNHLAGITRSGLQKIFHGNIELPLLEERVEVLRAVGAALVAHYAGRFRNFVRSAPPRLYDDGNGLLERLVREFPRFNDTSRYFGHEVKFWKLAQLGFWTLHCTLRRSGGFRLEDPERMTAFADYIVPVALRVLGILSYSPALERAIRERRLIARDSPEEVEIRAHTIYATALLCEEVNRLRPRDRQVIIPQIDARLWTHYHTTFWPHHLTRTIMY